MKAGTYQSWLSGAAHALGILIFVNGLILLLGHLYNMSGSAGDPLGFLLLVYWLTMGIMMSLGFWYMAAVSSVLSILALFLSPNKRRATMGLVFTLVGVGLFLAFAPAVSELTLFAP